MGKVADIVVLDRNLFEVAPEKLSEVKVVLTLFGGKEIRRAPEI